MTEDWPIISKYTWENAVNDGILVELWKEEWTSLHGSQPVLGTIGITSDLDDEELRKIYEDWSQWWIYTEPTLPEEQRHYETVATNGKRIWVIDDGTTVTIMYPEDY